jgi:hypothetical protein
MGQASATIRARVERCNLHPALPSPPRKPTAFGPTNSGQNRRDFRPSSRYRLSVICQSDLRKLARPAGFEPATPGLEGRCSIHLSYGRVPSFYAGGDSNGFTNSTPVLATSFTLRVASTKS